jgi:hypothetical protein
MKNKIDELIHDYVATHECIITNKVKERDDDIKSNKPIVPELEITVKNNKIDTIYVYRKP